MEILDLNNEEDTKKAGGKNITCQGNLKLGVNNRIRHCSGNTHKELCHYKCKYSVRLDGEHHTDWR